MSRDDEMAALSEVFEEVLAQSPRALLVEGEAGIGKTTLVERFLARHPDARVLRAAGDESEADVLFAIADQLLRSAAPGEVDVLGADSHLTVGMELLERLGSAEPTIVVVDDAHLADAGSLRALLFCARRLAESATLLLIVVRGTAEATLPEGWLKLADGAVVSLRPLGVEETRALGAQMGTPLTAAAAAQLSAHTGGNPLHLRAVLRELAGAGGWVDDTRPLPVPRHYAQMVEARFARCDAEVASLLAAAAVLGTRVPLHATSQLASPADPLAAVDRAVATGLIRLADAEDGTWLEFTHPLTRAAVYAALAQSRRSELHLAAARLASGPDAALRHRVAAAAVPDDALREELEAAAQAQLVRGGWAVAVRHLLAASRMTSRAGERERLLLDAIEALMYSGDGGAARRLAERTDIAEGPRRDSVWAYLAMFAGDVATAERLLERAWRHPGLGPRLASTVAQRRAFLAASRLRGAEAIEWAERATQLAPEDRTTALLAAPSLAIGLGLEGRIDEAHAALDRWLDDHSGFVLLALKARLLEAQGDTAGAADRFRRSADGALADNLLVIAGLSLAGLARTQYRAGAWDDAVVSAERAVAVATESEDRWVLAHALWSATFVPSARGDHAGAAQLGARVAAEPASFERHTALAHLVAAQLAAARERPAEVLEHLAPVAALGADYTALPWQHLQAHALVDAGRWEAAERFISEASALAQTRRHRLLVVHLHHARARLALVRRHVEAAAEAFEQARAGIEPLAMPYEQALLELEHAQLLRREGRRRAASELLLDARERFAALAALPAVRRCERELTACGLTPTARSVRDHALLTPQETAVTRLVVAGMSNREVAKELMLSTKTVEFHLSNIYLKAGVRSRAELRTRARADELEL
ncbi:AAA family ATPase [Solirubrobacter sp. CPCC 204708]|uniref:LuxR C-terminal-related transcriptional regulator n=1 Tax=Solirubrobacter deserti TaxID=2282478 RepID=A0ABT4RJ89_9ACTN|nr:LuxR family transcriptional regulator [Solirubrobacter deserti]MBE2317672.1 AAA family ATPase [Solirubrobacter deserti]MDA0138622.1 LuxR C-terminal-related transcriptional regulator [Solirubrobacter deserti]